MDRSQPMELANMCMLYDEKGRVLVEEKILGENEKGIIFPGGHVEPGESLKDSVIREMEKNRSYHFKSKALRDKGLDSGGWYKVSCTFI